MSPRLLAGLLACTLVAPFVGCTTFDGLTAREGGGGKGGSGEVPDGSSCERAIDLTFNKKANLQAPPEGNDQGECGGGLETDECKNPPELWFKYTLKTPAFLAVTALPTKPVTLDDACVKAERGAVVYARSSCDEGASELACLPLALADQGAPGPTRLRLTEAGTVYFAVDGRLSDTNELDVTVEVEPICTSNADCKQSGRPVCDTSKNVCYECLSFSDCKTPGKPSCNTAQGVCVACQTDADCKSPDARICGPQGECVSEGGCCDATPGIPGCSDSKLEKCVCAKDNFCCMGEWDDVCVGHITEFGCGLCPGSCKTSGDCKEPTKPVCDQTFTCVGCITNADCKDPKKPTCSESQCVECATSFQCKDPAKPVCVPLNGCVPSPNKPCLLGADQAEPGDDGPAGALDLTPAVGAFKQESTHNICNTVTRDVDFYKASVDDTDSLTVTLDWTDASQDFDLFVADTNGMSYGVDYFRRPAVVELNYLPKGTYYFVVGQLKDQPAPVAVSQYSIKVERTKGTKCAGIADCAKEFDTQIFRGSCNAASGACEFIDGKGTVTGGKPCDDNSDCTTSVCAAVAFAQDADKYAVCSQSCFTDNDCKSGEVCSAVTTPSFCTAKCTDDLNCPVDLDLTPSSGPWKRLSCDKTKGKCYQ